MWSSLKRYRQTLFVATGIILGLAVQTSAIWLGTMTRAGTENDARRELDNLVVMLAEQTDRTLQAVELVENGVIEMLGSTGSNTPADFEDAVHGRYVNRSLSDRVSGLPQVDALVIVGASGKILNFSRGWPIPDIDISDREFFQFCASRSNLKFYITEPVQTRARGNWTVYIARRVQNDKGEFLGLILGGLNLEYFQSTYRALALGQDGTVSLFRHDGRFLVRFPKLDYETSPATNPDNPLFNALFAGAEVANGRLRSSIDGADKFVSAKELTRFPMIVAASRPAIAVLAPWHRGLLYLFAGVLLIDLLIASAVFLAFKQFRSQATALHHANHDAVTKLPNRALLYDHLSAISAARRKFSLMLVDLDGFKDVNDTLGHSAGDEVLKQVAKRLIVSAGPKDIVARLGGDEFAIILPCGSGRYAEVADKVVTALAEPFVVDEQVLSLSGSVGIASCPEHATDGSELMSFADMALYQGKQEGKNCSRLFTPALRDATAREVTCRQEFPRAIEAQEFELFYQPQLRLCDGVLVGAEALIRWRHPREGLLQPSAFLPTLESSRYAADVGTWILRTACKQAAAWQRLGAPDFRIGVNLFGAQCRSGELIGLVERTLDEFELPASALEIELTENTVLRHDDELIAPLQALRKLGVGIAFDDYGTGYASLSLLKRFPLTRLKIDRTFVSGMIGSIEDDAIIRAILDLSRSFDLLVIAEGIETDEESACLRAKGCAEGQGYLFSPPVSARQFAIQYGLSAPERLIPAM